MKRRAFTLIELLVVIAIIAILAAILFPVFAQAREAARKASCQSNFKQVALAFNMYSTDFDGNMVPAATLVAPGYTFPNGCTIGAAGCGGYSVGAQMCCSLWGHSLYPYVKNVGVYSCPSNLYKYPGNYHPYGGISANPLAVGACGTPFNDSAFEKPADTVLFVDSGTRGAAGDYYLAWWGYAFANNATTVAPRHSETVTVGWVDGHVKAMKAGLLQSNDPYSCSAGHPLWRPFNKL